MKSNDWLFERILARLHCDEAFLESFFLDPESALAPYALDEAGKAALLGLDKGALLVAAESMPAPRTAAPLSPWARLNRLLDDYLAQALRAAKIG